jgi:hypothetical protein
MKTSLTNGSKAVGRSIVTATKATGNGYNQLVSDLHAVTEWIDEKIEVAKLNREMMRELDDMAGIMAEHMAKLNTSLELKESIKALDKQKILMEKVLKEIND